MAGLTLKNCDTSLRKVTSPKGQLLTLLPLASCLLTLLLGCTEPVIPHASAPTTQVNPKTDNVTSNTSNKVDESLAQFLPTTATATIAGRTINLEVTRTPQEQALGLMYRPTLPDDHGMLFNFVPSQAVAFWMKNVPVSLDMVFILKGKVVAIAHSAPPCDIDPCPIYPTKPVFVDQVIELRSGLANEIGLKVGDGITVNKKK